MDDIDQANQGGPSAEIPDLKKKDKERKRGGVAWSGSGGAGEFSGATGGTVARAAASAAADAAAGSAGALAELSAGAESGGLWAGISRFFAGLTATLLGKIAVAVGAVLFAAGVGLTVRGMLMGRGSGAGVGGPNFGSISDSLKVRDGGRDRMGIAGKGEIQFDEPGQNQAPAKPAEQPNAQAEKTAGGAEKDNPMPDVSGAAQQKTIPAEELAHNLSGAKLSSGLGGEFGGKNIFAGGNNPAARFGGGSGGLQRFQASKGALSNGASRTVTGSRTARAVRGAKSNRAFGQLRMSKGMSALGATKSPTAEQAATAAQGAFDQQQTTGGGLNTTSGGATTSGGGVVTPPSGGGGAPDLTVPTAPATPSGIGLDPGLQNMMNGITQLADEAAKMKTQGMMLLAAGAVMIGVGIYLLGFPFPANQIIGAILVGIGGMMVGMGFMMEQMASKMAAMAKQLGQNLAAETGNIQQGNIINYCTDQALQNGTPASQCNPPDSVTNAQQQSAQDAKDVNQAQQIPSDTPALGAPVQQDSGGNVSGTGVNGGGQRR